MMAMRFNKKAQMDDTDPESGSHFPTMVTIIVIALVLIFFFIFFLRGTSWGKSGLENYLTPPEPREKATDAETLLKCRDIHFCMDYATYEDCMLNPCSGVDESCQWYYNSCLNKDKAYDSCLEPEKIPLLDNKGSFTGCKICSKASCSDYGDEVLCLADSCGFGCMPFYDEKDGGWQYAYCRSCIYVTENNLGCSRIVKKELCQQNACGLVCSWDETSQTCSG